MLSSFFCFSLLVLLMWFVSFFLLRCSMHERSYYGKAICPSIHQMRGLWQNERTFGQHSYTIWKVDSSNFLTRRMVALHRGLSAIAELLVVNSNGKRSCHCRWQKFRRNRSSSLFIFTAVQYARAVLLWQSRPSVCLSKAWIVTKRKNFRPTFLYHMKGRYI